RAGGRPGVECGGRLPTASGAEAALAGGDGRVLLGRADHHHPGADRPAPGHRRGDPARAQAGDRGGHWAVHPVHRAQRGGARSPGQLVALPDFSLIGQVDPIGTWRLLGWGAALAIFSIMLSDFFDTLGTVTGIGARAGWLDAEGRLPRLNRVLLVDSLGAMF